MRAWFRRNKWFWLRINYDCPNYMSNHYRREHFVNDDEDDPQGTLFD